MKGNWQLTSLITIVQALPYPNAFEVTEQLIEFLTTIILSALKKKKHSSDHRYRQLGVLYKIKEKYAFKQLDLGKGKMLTFLLERVCNHCQKEAAVVQKRRHPQ